MLGLGRAVQEQRGKQLCWKLFHASSKHRWLETQRYLALRNGAVHWQAGACGWRYCFGIYHLVLFLKHIPSSLLSQQEGRCGWGKRQQCDQSLSGCFFSAGQLPGIWFCFGKIQCLFDVASLKRVWNDTGLLLTKIQLLRRQGFLKGAPAVYTCAQGKRKTRTLISHRKPSCLVLLPSPPVISLCRRLLEQIPVQVYVCLKALV